MLLTYNHHPPAREKVEDPDEMTVAGLSKWLKKFDTDHDGRINRDELRRAVRERRRWFTTFWGMLAFHRADKNRNGFIDDGEINHLVDFAQKVLGFKITAH